MERYVKSTPYNMLHICIDSNDLGVIKGRVYNPTLESPIMFNDIHELLLKVDQMFDINGNPMSSHIKRSFKKEVNRYMVYQRYPKLLCKYEDLFKYEGDIKTVDIVVLTRQSSSWQGYYYEDDNVYSFKETLQLIRYLDNAVNGEILI